MPFINFGEDGFNGPSTFEEAGPEQTLILPDGITISGGVVLGNETFLAVEDPSVYGTAAPFGDVQPDPSLVNDITITFPTPVSSFAVELFNGQTVSVTYQVSDNVGDSTTITLPPNSSNDAGVVVLPVSKGATTFTIMSQTTPWDFSVDNISYNFSQADVQKPKNPVLGQRFKFAFDSAAIYYSLFELAAAPETAGLSLFGEIFEFGSMVELVIDAKSLGDPFDPNYKQEFFPTFYQLPAIPADSIVTPQTADDANTAVTDLSKSISYMQAMYVTLNRLQSAKQAGDQPSVALQNAALDTYLSLASSSLHALGGDLTTVMNDLAGMNLNVAVSPQNISTFQANLRTSGFAALPQEEQTLFNLIGFSATDEQAAVNELLAADPSSTFPSFVSALQEGATKIDGLGSILAGTAKSDFNGNGLSDLLWADGGTFTEWQSTGNAFTPNTFIGSVASGWTLAGIGDVNGDGRADLIWQNGTSFTEWQSGGGRFIPNVFIGTVAPGWNLVGMGNFSGDGNSGLIWQNGGTFTEWRSTGNGFMPNVYVGSVGAGWKLVGVGDFNGDYMSDLIWQNGGTFTEWRSTGNGFTPNVFVGSVGAGWKLVGIGDFNGDGLADLIWQNGNTFTEWQSNGNGFKPNAFVGSVGPGWTVAAIGDFNGDGFDDILFRNTNGTFTEWQSNGNGFTPNVVVNTTVASVWTLEYSTTGAAASLGAPAAQASDSTITKTSAHPLLTS